MNNVEEKNLGLSYAILDEDTAIELATDDYIATLVPGTSYDVKELVSGLMEAIYQAYDEHNVVADKPKKFTYPKVLPNLAIAKLLLFMCEIRMIDYSGNPDTAILAVYQGIGEGIYSISDNAISAMIRRVRPNASKNVIEEVVDILKTKAKLVAPTRDRDLIAVNNGIFDYKTKQLLPFSPEYVFTAKCKVNYVPNALKPVITMPDGLLWDPDTWFESLSDNIDIVKLLWQVTGAIIRPHVRWDKVVCFYSQKGMNGKGTLCELMKQLCGEGAYASIPFNQFEKDFVLEGLMTATSVICDENGTADFSKNPATLKACVTGDSFMLNTKYKSPRSISWSGLIVECCNALPRISDNTESLYRRMLMINFEKTFMGIERKYIKEDYLHRAEVLEYVLNKVLNTNFYEFDIPEACEELLQDYKNYNDPVRQFVDSIFPLFSWDLVPQQFVRDLYKNWRAKHNPSAAELGDRTLDDKIVAILMSDYSEEWDFVKGKQHRVTKNNMDGPEYLIAEYGLTDWMSKTYKGNDPDKLCVPTLNQKYKGYVRKISAQISEDDSDEQED